MFSKRKIGLPCGLAGKESSCNAGDLGSIPGLERSPGGGHGIPLQYSGLENPQEQRSLEGYSPWGRKESDTTERLSSSSQGSERFPILVLLHFLFYHSTLVPVSR